MKEVIFKNFKAWMLIIAVALGVTSCEKEPISEVPGAISIECKAGDNPTISFTAMNNWQLSSNATWCQFVTSAGNMQEMAGGVGTHTITLNITDDNNGNKWSTAEITMKMGDQKGVIATVKRHPKELYMKLSDISEGPQQVFEIGYVDYVPMYVEGNFYFAATEIPYWVEVKQINEDTGEEFEGSITGEPGVRSYIQLRIVNDGDRERYAIEKEDGHVIKFADEDGTVEFEFPIIYKGMGQDKLTFTGPTEINYGWEVTLDGKTFRQHDSSNGTSTTFNDELEFNITAQDDLFDILYFEQKIDRGISSYELLGINAYDNTDEKRSWLHFNKETMILTVDESSTTRYGIVIALPRGIYNKVRGDIKKYIFDVDGASGIDLPIINQEYEKFVIIELTQSDFDKQESNDNMYIYHSLTTLEIPAKEFTDATIMGEYGVEEAYIVPFVNSVEGKKPGIVIDPHVEGWTTENFEQGIATAEVYHMGDKLKISDDEYYLGENKDENMALYLWGPMDGWQDENVYILFKIDGQAKRLLVVTPPVM